MLTAPPGRPVVIAQISDMHIKTPGVLAYGVVDTAAALANCVEFLNTLEPRPDVVVASGDLVDSGSPIEYKHLRQLLAPLTIPLLVLAGNHDDRDTLRGAFKDHEYLAKRGPLNAAVSICPGLELLLLDSTIPGKPYGALEPETLSWLEERLRCSDDSAIIFLHHPPFETGIRHMDRQNLRNADALAEVLKNTRRVRLIAAGHVHRTTMTSFSGIPASIAPCPAHAVALDFNPHGLPAFKLEPPGIHLHTFRDSSLVTHLVPIGTFKGPYPFFDAAGKLL